MSPMSSVDDESSIHFEKRTDLLLQGMRRPVRTVSGPVSSSLKKKFNYFNRILISSILLPFGLNMNRKIYEKCNLAKFCVSSVNEDHLLVSVMLGQSIYISSGSHTKSPWRIQDHHHGNNNNNRKKRRKSRRQKSLFSLIAITNEVFYSIHQCMGLAMVVDVVTISFQVMMAWQLRLL